LKIESYSHQNSLSLFSVALRHLQPFNRMRKEDIMDIEKVRDFANQNPVCWLSTAEGDLPHVRGMLMWFADETGFYFHTGSVKQLYQQMKKNCHVEVAFHHLDAHNNASVMIRVAGKVEFVRDNGLQDRLLRERPFLQDVVQHMSDGKLVIFKIATGEAQFWDMSVNCREKEQPRIRF
jgi:pyridoxamine 5'-phosphate oxidase